jgi:hypothetical protein
MGMLPAVAVYAMTFPLMVTVCLVTMAESTCKIRLLVMGLVFFGGVPDGACAKATITAQSSTIEVSNFFMICDLNKSVTVQFDKTVKTHRLSDRYQFSYNTKAFRPVLQSAIRLRVSNFLK